MNIAPAAQTYLGLPGAVLHAILLAVALGTFSFILWRRLLLLREGAPDPRWDRIGTRLWKLLILGFGQARHPRYPVAGTLHILIFFGFLTLLLRSLTLLGEGFSAGFVLPGLGGWQGDVYASIKDWVALVVLVAVVIAVIRRAVFKPARYHDRHARQAHHGEAYVILGLIGLLMVADAFYEGAAMALAGERVLPGMPLASTAAALSAGMEDGSLRSLHIAAFWVHNVALLFFLCYLPLSKHFHVISSLPNVFLLNLEPGGKVKPPRHEQPDLDALERLGVEKLEDFTWKHILDFYTCTDCGRCSDACPAYATGTALSPRMISIKSRDVAYASYPVIGRRTPAEDRPALLGDIIADEELWACTTCRACEDACPVLIEYVDKIVDMRRALVENGRVDRGLQKAMADLERKGNPYGQPARKRGDWVAGENGDASAVRVLKQGEEADVLFFTDSGAAFDPRLQQIARAFGTTLTESGIDVGTLGRDEVDSGNEARRIGEEGLFEVLRDQNMDALESREYREIVTTDPHAFNGLRHDYTLDVPVTHHSQVLARMVRDGSLRFRDADDDRVYTFHDPCYLGRHNDVYDDPRQVLEAVPGLRTVEMERSRNRSFCCGGGSLYLFYEVERDANMGPVRADMAAEAGADVIVTACPFCMVNLEDAIKTTGREEAMEVIDLAELVERFRERSPDDELPIEQGQEA